MNRTISIVLAMIFVFGLFPLPTAFADDVVIDADWAITGEGTEETVEGDLTSNGGEVVVSDGAVLTVEGDFTYNSENPEATTGTGPEIALEINTGEVTITGDMSAEATQGVFVSGGDSSFTSEGNVEVSSNREDVSTTGVIICTPSNDSNYMDAQSGSVEIDIGGNLNVEAPYAVGIEMEPSTQFNSEIIEVNVDGNLNVRGTSNSPGNVQLSNEDTAKGLSLHACDSNVKVTTGEINTTGDKATAIEYFIQMNHSLEINTGTIKAESKADGYEAKAIEGEAWHENTNVSINVDGSIDGYARLSSKLGATSNINVTGEAFVYIAADNSSNYAGSTATADVSNGGAYAFSCGTDSVAVLHISNDAYNNGGYFAGDAVMVQAEPGGTATATVDGNVEGGVWVRGSGDSEKALSSVNLDVGGNVTGGITASTWNADNAEIDVLIEGTLSSEQKLVTVDGDSIDESLTLTVWKVDLGDRDTIVEAAEDSDNQKEAEKVEKNILYIIKYDQPTVGGTLSVTDKDGNALQKSHDHEVAKEGETVLLKLDVQDGYQVTGAFNGEGEKVELLKDDAGNYYVVVPKGGAVYLSAALEKIPEKPVEPDKEKKPGKPDKIPAPPVPGTTQQNAVLLQMDRVTGSYVLNLTAREPQIVFIRSTLERIMKYNDTLVVRTDKGSLSISLAEILNLVKNAVTFRFVITDEALEIWIDGNLEKSFPFSEFV